MFIYDLFFYKLLNYLRISVQEVILQLKLKYFTRNDLLHIKGFKQ
jgi:hypothetical protein